MPSKKHYKTIREIVLHFIGNYYREVSERPMIRQDPERHAKTIYHINLDYLKALKDREKQFNYEEGKEKFIEDIEIRTQFQKKAREEQEKKDRNKSLFSQVKSNR